MVFRLLVAEVVTRFDVQFPVGDDGSKFPDKVEEAHTWRLPALQLRVSSYVK